MADLPAGYVPSDPDSIASLERREAWSTYDILTGDDDIVYVEWATNDNLDYGYPTESATDRYNVRSRDGQTALMRALENVCGGGSRHGIGQACIVRVDGVVVERG